jgi:hypothetical protein
LSRRRRRAYSRNALHLHLNLNRELNDEARGGSLKYFSVVVGALLYIFYSRIGLG